MQRKPNRKQVGKIPPAKRSLSRLVERKKQTKIMLEKLWDIGLHSADPGIKDPRDAAALSEIRNRIFNENKWTIADYTNVLRIYKKYFGQR